MTAIVRASYRTPEPSLTVDEVAATGADPQPARAALVVQWVPGQEEAALTEAQQAFDTVVSQIIAAHLAAIRC